LIAADGFNLVSPSKPQPAEEALPCTFPAEAGTSMERRAGVGLAVLLNELATGLLGDGCLRDGLLNGEDSKPLNNDFLFFFTGAGDGDAAEVRDGDGMAG
jgi:hypothetical protein